MSVESAIADLNEMKSRIQFAEEEMGITVAEEDVVDSTTTAILKVDEHQPATTTPENQVTVIMAKSPVRFVGNASGSAAVVGRPNLAVVCEATDKLSRAVTKDKLRKGCKIRVLGRETTGCRLWPLLMTYK